MSRFSKQVRVVANPFHVLDHRGRPCGVFPEEPRAVGQHLGYVGAKVDTSKTKVLRAKAEGDIRPSFQNTEYAFSADAVSVPTTPYYRQGLRSGAILPADEATATWAGVTFSPPASALEQARKTAEAAFERAYGEGSLAEARGQEVAPPKELQRHPAAGAPVATTKDSKSRRGGEPRPTTVESANQDGDQ
jgi:hypothetical protein